MKELRKNLPEGPGIYKFLDEKKTVIYVGKAKSLRARVNTYFNKDYAHSNRTRLLLKQMADIDVIETDTELEALLLESTLIKELQPRYNILMKDDKSYVYIKIQMDEDFPRIQMVRQHTLQAQGDASARRARYFGPKLADNKVYETLRLLKKLFPYRHCKLNIAWKKPNRSGDTASLALSPQQQAVNVTNRVIDFPCIDYYIKRCPAPCIGAIAPRQYEAVINNIIDFLKGNTEKIEGELEAQMHEAATARLFEKAARIRDKLLSIQGISEKQKIAHAYGQDTDVIAHATGVGHIYFAVLQMRNGKMTDAENFALDALDLADAENAVDLPEAYEAFIRQYYERAAEIPKEVLTALEVESTELLSAWLSNGRKNLVKLRVPQRGEKNALVDLALKNATSFARQHRIKWLAQEQMATASARLADILGLRELKRIEGFDISHLGGSETVGSMVVFENGTAKSCDYRHFKLRTVINKPDDYQSMYEVLMRRLKYLSNKTFEGITFGRGLKKDFPEIEKRINDEVLATDDLKKEQFLVAKLNKEIVAFCRLKMLDPKTPIISSLWVTPKARGNKLGYELMRRLIKKYKVKKVYVDIQKKLEEYYAIFGFIPLKNPPAVLVQHTQEIDSLRKEEGKSNPPPENLMYMVYEASKRKIDASLSARPDLLVIDGGKGQLAQGVEALKQLKLEIPVIALAKRLEEIFRQGEAAPILLEESDEALKLLQRIRDESHRFAITFQRGLHRKTLLNS